MDTISIANKLVELNRAHRYDEIFDTLYAPNAVSVEAATMPGMDREAKGVAAIKAKGEWWANNHEIHSITISGPWPHDDRFVVGFGMDVTHKPSGQRIQMDEVGLYTVKNGKVVREEFFYNAG